MYIYMAPIESIGGYVYRNALDKFFPGADEYFIPFISCGKLTRREEADIAPANNPYRATAQIMGGYIEPFMEALNVLTDLGYDHVNLNLGCPSGTVVSKKKGSGVLGDVDRLDRLLDDIYSKSTVPVSIKTRIGLEDYENWNKIMDIYNSYPVERLIIHPRTRKEMYSGALHMDAFNYACECAKMPLVYNGEIRTVSDYEYICRRYPDIAGVMIGREVLRRPWFLGELQGRGDIEKSQMRKFHDYLYNIYKENLSGDSHLLSKMKDLWYHLGEGMDGIEKPLKKLKKSTRLADYDAAVAQIFEMATLGSGCASLGSLIREDV